MMKEFNLDAQAQVDELTLNRENSQIALGIYRDNLQKAMDERSKLGQDVDSLRKKVEERGITL